MKKARPSPRNKGFERASVMVIFRTVRRKIQRIVLFAAAKLTPAMKAFGILLFLQRFPLSFEKERGPGGEFDSARDDALSRIESKQPDNTAYIIDIQ